MHFGILDTRLNVSSTPCDLYDWYAASTKTATDSELLPASKKPKKLNSTKPSSAQSAKLPSHDAANQQHAGACPDLSNAPTHGPDEPLLLDYPGNDTGEKLSVVSSHLLSVCLSSIDLFSGARNALCHNCAHGCAVPACLFNHCGISAAQSM